MLKKIREWLVTPAGKITVCACCVPVLALTIYSLYSFAGGSSPAFANYTTYICSETGKTFRHRNTVGETLPIRSPYSGKETGVPAEACYWNKDGSIKTEPTWVLLNEFVNKPGPTFCPDCGRLVVGHNPHPGPGVNPPPVQEEWIARAARRNAGRTRSDVAGAR